MSKNKSQFVVDIRPRDLRKNLILAMDAGLPVMIHGSPGIGKSDIVKAIADEQGREVYDIRLALMDAVDLRGIPYFNPEDKSMNWGAPSEFPIESLNPKASGILFLDEINSAPQMVQAAAYQLVLNRRIGPHKIPAGVSIIAAGNLESDKGVVIKMPKPLSNRFVHFQLKVDNEDWERWAFKNEVHPEVIAYVCKHAPNQLHQFDPKDPSHAFPTPRSWYFVSKMLYRADKENINDTLVGQMITGTIGAAAADFISWRRSHKDIPTPLQIITGEVKTLKNREISGQFLLMTGLLHEIKRRYDALKTKGTIGDREYTEKEWFEQMENTFSFVGKNLESELVILIIKNMNQIHNVRITGGKVPSYNKLFSDNIKLISRDEE